MDTTKIIFAGEEFTLRTYSVQKRFTYVIDRFMHLLAYEWAEDYTNPPDYHWAVIFSYPAELLDKLPKNTRVELTDDERRFLSKVQAVVVHSGRHVFVRYFSSLEDAKRYWNTLKSRAEKFAQRKE